MRHSVRISVFIALLPLAYIVSSLLLSSIYFNGYSALNLVTGNPLRPGNWGQTLRRFRELEQVGQVDLLFLGSSHAYRGFDPRIFAKGGYRAFNMGTSAQTPLNSYYLLKHYLSKLSPKLIVYDIYPLLLANDGLESNLDLVTNLPLSEEIVEMTLATRKLNAINCLVRTKFERIRHPLDQVKQKVIDGEAYIDGGYCETLRTKSSAHAGKTSNLEMSDTQLEYLTKIISYVKSKNCELLLVTQPLPREYVQNIKNYHAISTKISDIARTNGVTYIDYNSRLCFDSSLDFYDNDHLTSSGVKKYNPIVLQDISVKLGGR